MACPVLADPTLGQLLSLNQSQATTRLLAEAKLPCNTRSPVRRSVIQQDNLSRRRLLSNQGGKALPNPSLFVSSWNEHREIQPRSITESGSRWPDSHEQPHVEEAVKQAKTEKRNNDPLEECTDQGKEVPGHDRNTSLVNENENLAFLVLV